MPRKSPNRSAPSLEVPRSEQLLIDELPCIFDSGHVERVLCTSLGRGQFAAAAGQGGAVRVTCHFLDVYLAGQAERWLAESSVPTDSGSAVARVEIVCAAGFPEGPFDLAALPVDPRGDAELTRDCLQSAYERLADRGRLVAAVSNPDDQWLHGELRKLFEKVTRRPSDTGVLYLATKTQPLRKRKNFTCEFAFRDGDRLIHAVSRPGVFSHRSLDGGARALLGTMQVHPGGRVLDLGCGSGVVGLAAALRAADVHVVAIDSNARAIECTSLGAALNGLSCVSTLLNADGECGAPGTFDLVLGNPPYYSDFQIAEVFLQGARRALKPGGQVLIVSKAPAWFEERMSALFEEVQCLPHKTYTVVQARQGSV